MHEKGFFSCRIKLESQQIYRVLSMDNSLLKNCYLDKECIYSSRRKFETSAIKIVEFF